MHGCGECLNNSNMVTSVRPPPAPAPPPGLPVYALYGESGQSSATDWLHCETIAERSRLHDWEIRPHRHAALFQILYIRQGRARAWLESGTLALAGPAVLRVPALVPHGFSFEPGIEGVVVTVLEAHLRRLLAEQPALAERLLRAQPLALAVADPAAAALDAALTRLQAEHAGSAAWRGLALDAALLEALVAIGRLAASDSEGQQATAGAALAPGRAQGHVQRYRTLVDRRFREQPRLAELAAELGITPTQLNRVCRQVLGQNALAVLHARLLLEAQRELAYTTLGIKQIALGLGFGDAGYFSRFFQRATGVTPSAWRGVAGDRVLGRPRAQEAERGPSG